MWRTPAIPLALASAAVFADNVTVCSPTLPETELRAGLSRNERTSFRDSTNGFAPRRTVLAVDWRISEGWSTGIEHRYTDLNIEGVPVQGNGHLHTVWLPLRYQRGADGRSVTLALAPAISATSNSVRRPGHWSGDDLQLLAAAIWSLPLQDEASLHVGLCRDYRIGTATIYPLLRYDGQSGQWRYRAGYPESSLTHVLGERLDVSIGIAPAGNRWRAYARDLHASSPLEHSAWYASARIDWQLLERTTVSLIAGSEFDNRWRFTLTDGTRVERRSDASLRAGMHLRWRF